MKNNSPLVSVIVPIYNMEKYLRKCVDSIINQTYHNLEIILVDDGSPDQCPQICDEYAEKDSRIVVIHKKNGGLSSARNAALDVCQGDYIGFIDSDDYIEPNMYENLLEAIITEDGAIGATGVAVESESGITKYVVNADNVDESKGQYVESLLLHKGDVSVCSKLFHREIIGCHRFDETKQNEDLLFVFEIEKNFSKIKYTGLLGYHYIIHAGSLSRSFGKAIHDMVCNAKTVRTYIDNNYPELKKQAERFEIYQNIAFLRNVPQGYNREEDTLCSDAEKFLKKCFARGMMNPYLSIIDKIQLIMLVVAPKITSSLFHLLLNFKKLEVTTK